MRRIFNFNLPDELRNYLKLAAEERHTTISQYIIDLIVKDQNIRIDKFLGNGK